MFGLIQKDDRWSAVFASKIGGESGIDRHSGGDEHRQADGRASPSGV
jgi:hypothetical protein